MNTVKDLIDNGIHPYTAKKMIESFSDIVGAEHGDYVITDVVYDHCTRDKIIEARCRYCGDVISRRIKPKRRWDCIKKRCSCRGDRNKKIRESEKRQILECRVGKRYGDFDFISLDDINGCPRYTVRCVRCGYEKIVSAYNFDYLNLECHECNKKKIKYDKSYIGRKNNMLTVIGFKNVGSGKKWFECRCDCGNIKTVKPTFWENGTVKSCGCLAASRTLKHSEELDRLRRIHSGMIQRCYNPNSHAYQNYGGRGISICDEWRFNRDAFIEWSLSHGYSNDLTIDRIDNDGNYEPNNCRWANRKMQANNQRRDKIVPPKNKPRKTWTIDGVTKFCKDWCKEYGLSYNMVAYRIDHKGLTPKEALTTKKFTDGRTRKTI